MLRKHSHQSHVENHALHQHPHECHHEEIVEEYCHHLAANLGREKREGEREKREGEREKREGEEGGRRGRERGREGEWEVEGIGREGAKGMERYTIVTDIHLRGTHHTSPWLHSNNEGQLCSHETDTQVDMNVATHTPQRPEMKEWKCATSIQASFSHSSPAFQSHVGKRKEGDRT